MRKIQIVVIICLIGFLDSTYAQQNPHYTQYMYNLSVVNPAYAGSKESMSGGLLYRKQWVEIEDAPQTGTFFLHSPVGKNVGLGLSAITDQLGPVESTSVFGDFSYTLNLDDEHRLAFGLKGGATFHKVGLFSDIGNGNVPDPDDPAFQQDANSTFFNLGTGVFYYTDKYYVSLSVPNLFRSIHLDYDGRQFGSEELHYFLTGGYVFDLNPNLKFKPFAMVKSSFNAPVSFDVSTNFLFMERFEIGATYRIEDSVGAIFSVFITPNLRLGYAYDHITSDLNVSTPASHEFILLFDLNFLKKVSQSPRFF